MRVFFRFSNQVPPTALKSGVHPELDNEPDVRRHLLAFECEGESVPFDYVTAPEMEVHIEPCECKDDMTAPEMEVHINSFDIDLRKNTVWRPTQFIPIDNLPIIACNPTHRQKTLSSMSKAHASYLEEEIALALNLPSLCIPRTGAELEDAIQSSGEPAGQRDILWGPDGLSSIIADCWVIHFTQALEQQPEIVFYRISERQWINVNVYVSPYQPPPRIKVRLRPIPFWVGTLLEAVRLDSSHRYRQIRIIPDRVLTETAIPADWSPNCDELVLYGLMIREIPPSWNPRCDRLVLRRNLITGIPTGWGPSCPDVCLDDNQIVEFPKQWLEGLPAGSIVDLCDNQITMIPFVTAISLAGVSVRLMRNPFVERYIRQMPVDISRADPIAHQLMDNCLDANVRMRVIGRACLRWYRYIQAQRHVAHRRQLMELKFLPPIASKGFPGGTFYRQSCQHFHSMI